jgi:hypothetical protein
MIPENRGLRPSQCRQSVGLSVRLSDGVAGIGGATVTTPLALMVGADRAGDRAGQRLGGGAAYSSIGRTGRENLQRRSIPNQERKNQKQSKIKLNLHSGRPPVPVPTVFDSDTVLAPRIGSYTSVAPRIHFFLTICTAQPELVPEPKGVSQ